MAGQLNIADQSVIKRHTERPIAAGGLLRPVVEAAGRGRRRR
jgi:hypothetical protein